MYIYMSERGVDYSPRHNYYTHADGPNSISSLSIVHSTVTPLIDPYNVEKLGFYQFRWILILSTHRGTKIYIYIYTVYDSNHSSFIM